MNTSQLRQSLAMKYGVLESSVSDSFLRSDYSLTNGVTTINFEFLKQNKQNAYTTDQLLDRNDVFCVTHWALRIYQAADTTAGRSAANLQTYPNATHFANTTAANLFKLYNAGLSVTIDNFIYYTAYDCNRFLFIPKTQQGEVSAAVIDTMDAITTYPIDYSERSENSGFAMLYNSFNIAGNSKNTITLNMADATALAPTAGTNLNYVSLTCRGFLVQGAVKAS